MILIYLAAGMGKRLRKISKDKPKCFTIINKKKIIDYNKANFSLFKKVLIVTGYKSNLINKEFKLDKKIKLVHNKNYKITNMVESTFLVKKYIKKSDVVICYGDIIFNRSIIKKLIKIKKKNLMPLNSNWLNLWKKRMNYKNIIKDAENIKIKNNYISEIGTKIKKKLPLLQFMGLIKLSNKSFNNLFDFYKTKNRKIDFTSFINDSIKSGKIKINYFKTGKEWIEIDNVADIDVANKILENNDQI